MGQESMGKKDREKKKAKKKRDKEEKKEERKQNNNKGKELDDMLAYVDEYGNISATPPDPTRKVEINPEDIQLGAAKQEEVDPADLIRKGTVKFFNDEKGYGFINDTKTRESIFVHNNNVEEKIKEGDKVVFEVEQGQKGPIAVRVKKDA